MWGWIVIVIVVLGGGAVALFALGGDDDKKSDSATTIVLTPDTDGGEPVITQGPDTNGSSPVDGGGGTREAPIPVGQIADIGADWRLQVLDVIPDAGEMMAANDEFFQPAPEGHVYLLVKVALGYFGVDDPKVGFEPDLAVLGSSSVALDNFCLTTTPDEVDLFDYVFTGGVLTGYRCYVAPVEEAGTFILFGKGDFFSDEGVYFALGTPETPVQPMAALVGPQPGADSTPARLNPTPIGIATAVGPDWMVTVTGAARDITSEVLAENEFNEPPPTGFRYVGVDLTFAYNGSGAGAPSQVSLGAVGSDNVQHSGYCGVVPGELDLYTDLFAGGSASGTVCLLVPETSDSLLLYATPDSSEFVWFAIG